MDGLKQPQFYHRDISWLYFNGRILEEAGMEEVPLLAKINFLAIYSCNLDEFYRVRMPVLSGIRQLRRDQESLVPTAEKGIHRKASALIENQQQEYGRIMLEHIIPDLQKQKVYLLYDQTIPEAIQQQTEYYFFPCLAA